MLDQTARAPVVAGVRTGSTAKWREGPARVAGDAGPVALRGRLWSRRARQSTAYGCCNLVR